MSQRIVTAGCSSRKSFGITAKPASIGVSCIFGSTLNRLAILSMKGSQEASQVNPLSDLSKFRPTQVLEQPRPQRWIIRPAYDIVHVMTQDYLVSIFVHENVDAVIGVHFLKSAAVIVETKYPL